MRKAWRSVENKETHKWRLLLWFASCLIIWVDIGQPHPHQAPPNTMWGKHQTPCLAAKTPNIMSDSENTKHHVWQTLNNSEKYAESSDEKTFVSSNVWLLTFKILWQKVLKPSSKMLIREEEKMKVSRRESFWIIALSPNASFLVSLLSTNDVNWAFLRSTGTAGIFRRVQEGKSYSPDDDSQGKGKANDESLLEVRLYLVTDVLHQTKINLIFANFSASTHFWFRRLHCTIA